MKNAYLDSISVQGVEKFSGETSGKNIGKKQVLVKITDPDRYSLRKS